MSDTKNREDLPISNDELLEQASRFRVPQSGRSREEAWEAIVGSIEQRSTSGKRLSLRQIAWAFAASVLVLIVGLTIFLLYSPITVSTDIAQTREVVLPDGSVVNLNAQSGISYSRLYAYSDRTVRFYGEGFFKVVPGSTFSVIDSCGRKVEVLGTEFNLFSRRNLYTVTCYSGRVRVTINPQTQREIGRGEKTVSREGKLRLITLSNELTDKPKWIEGTFAFDKSSLIEVFSEIERRYGIRVHFKGIDPAKRYYSGEFPQTDLPAVLDMITLPMGLNWKFSPDSTIAFVFPLK